MCVYIYICIYIYIYIHTIYIYIYTYIVSYYDMLYDVITYYTRLCCVIL